MRRITRRRVLGMGGLVAAGGVVGGAAYAWRRSSGGRKTATQRPVFAGQVPVGLTQIDDAFERREFASGEEIDWDNGIFFLQRDGRVEGYRANQASLEAKWKVPSDRTEAAGDGGGPQFTYPFARYESLAGGEFIRARLFPPREDRAALLHRGSGAAFTWDDQELMIWGVGPYLTLSHIGHLNLERYHGQSEWEPTDFSLIDGGLNLLRSETMSEKAGVGFDQAYNGGYDGSRDRVFYFRPTEGGKSRELVAIDARGTNAPESVDLLPEMDRLNSLYDPGLWRAIQGPDRRSLRAENHTPRERAGWLMPFGEEFRRVGSMSIGTAGPLLSQSGTYAAREAPITSPTSYPDLVGWRSVVVEDADTGKALLRVRSANLNDPYFELDRWDGDQALYLNVLGTDAAHFKFGAKSASLLRMPGTATGESGAAPSPGNPDLIALNQTALLDRASGVRVAASVPPDSEAQNLDPWSGRAGEVVFGLWKIVSSYEDSVHLPLMLDPVVEFAPFDDELAFYAKSASEIRDRPLAHAGATGSVGPSELLRLVRQTRHEDWNGYTTGSPQQGNTFDAPWAHVQSPTGAQGWIPIVRLKWSMGTAL